MDAKMEQQEVVKETTVQEPSDTRWLAEGVWALRDTLVEQDKEEERRHQEMLSVAEKLVTQLGLLNNSPGFNLKLVPQPRPSPQ